MVTKTEQIHALLQGEAYDLAIRELNVSHMARSSYTDVFTVTRNDVDDYVAEHGIPAAKYCTTPGIHPCEGLHFIHQGDQWSTYWLERGEISSLEDFDTEAAAIDSVVTWLLKLSGAGSLFLAHDQST